MPLLFSYGTLRHADVQRKTFAREIRSEPDTLSGYARGTAGPHANAVFTGDAADHVEGAALEVTDAELAAADAFERQFDYRRIEVTLDSRRAAWVYVWDG
ncbi:MAG TPA: gamma-glutamylcyclotransferase family protein [Vicinamibacterales bacterium]|jgi:gamma-glutamylcyclotransferase (GGCT)/AIG2-like uncharacterized protein YtfP|nr:gamma-glutamylcyclotransferase family protein [Vicinamibacterales bacterium]